MVSLELGRFLLPITMNTILLYHPLDSWRDIAVQASNIFFTIIQHNVQEFYLAVIAQFPCLLINNDLLNLKLLKMFLPTLI